MKETLGEPGVLGPQGRDRKEERGRGGSRDGDGSRSSTTPNPRVS